MSRKKLVFYHNGSLAPDGGGGLTLKSMLELEDFLNDLQDEIAAKLGYVLGEDYSFYINYDATLAVDSRNDDVIDKVTDYVYTNYEIEFKKKEIM